MNRSARHGGEVYAAARAMHTTAEALLDFSSNANIFAEPLTRRLVAETAYPFLHYPDSDCAALRDALAAHEEAGPEQILAGNGAAELIWLAIQGLAPRKVLLLGPAFSEYAAACEAFGAAWEVVTPPVADGFACGPAELARLWNTDADLVILCTPNNPGTVTYENMAAILDMLRAPRVLVDTSYREFLYGTPAYAECRLSAFRAALRPGVALFTLNSFTKFFCCPGIRLGYLTGDRSPIERLAARRASWTVSPFAQQMGELFLASLETYRETLGPLRVSLAHAARELRRHPVVDDSLVLEGPGFLTARLAPSYTAGQVCAFLRKRRILVRNCDPIPGMPPGFIRVQARPAEDTARLLESLDQLTLA